MAPRRNSRASAQISGNLSTVTIADLPDEVLVHALGFLTLLQRQRAALVSRRFAAAACNPLLLRDVQLPIIRNPNSLNSLAAWLARHAQHLQTLKFGSELSYDHLACGMASAVATCLTAAGAAGPLRELTVYALPELHTGWLCTMRSLQYLRLSSVQLFIAPAVASLAGLRSLELAGESHFEAGARLPTGITRLVADGDLSDGMPPQFVQLPHLQRLKLVECWYSPDSLSQLSALAGSLTRLEVNDMDGPAAGLAPLSRLQHLLFQVDNEAAVEAARDALPHLTALTCLTVDVLNLDPLLPALSGLSQLQLCQLAASPAAAEAPALPLPGGPWLRSLRWLSTGIDTLLSSASVLQDAISLECISVIASVTTVVNWRSPASTALFAWLARHPPLRRLSIIAFHASPPFNSKGFADKLRQLRNRRPALLVKFPVFGEQGEALLEYLGRTQPF